MKIEELPIKSLVPYENNPRINDESVDAVANSIREFGFRVPILVDGDNVIIAGHTRLKASEQLGLETVPVVRITDLTPEQVRAYRIADNATSSKSLWDFEKLEIELGDISLDMSDFGLDDIKLDDWFQSGDTGEATEEDSEEYKDFLEKFEPKRTTDDCYTPEKIYEAIADWVSKEYGVSRKRFVRPFYPGGDYQKEKYNPGDIVMDNPPFSILSEIVKFYLENKIRFFVFCPAMLGINSGAQGATLVACGVQITYANGALVPTSFVTNLEDPEIICRSAPELYQAVKAANDEILAEQRKELPVYSYPDHICTAAMLVKYSKYGVAYYVNRSECEVVSALDAQKEQGKAIYGKGLLLAEKAAAEKAAAEKAAAEKAAATRWPLSEREKDIVRKLGEAAR